MARNSDGLFKRRGIWAFKYRDATGAWREKSTGEKTYSSAREVRREFLDLARTGDLPRDTAKLSLGQALQNRFEFIEATGSRNSVAPTRTSMEHLKRVIGAARRVDSITISDIKRYQIVRSKEQHRGKTTSPKTINNEIQHLVAVLKEAKLWRPMEDDYRPLRVPKLGPGKALDPEEGERLFRVACMEDRWRVAFLCSLLAYATGCRTSEIRSLQLRNISLERGCISVERHKTKSNAGAREVVLGPIAAAAVRELLHRAKVLGATEPEHYLLPANLSKHTKENDPLRGQTGFDPTRHQSTWSTAWKSLKIVAGLPSFRFHDLRHARCRERRAGRRDAGAGRTHLAGDRPALHASQ